MPSSASRKARRQTAVPPTESSTDARDAVDGTAKNVIAANPEPIFCDESKATVASTSDEPAAAAAAPQPMPLTDGESARRQAQREHLKLVTAPNTAGFLGVRYKPLEANPYKAWICDADGRYYHLGYHGCAEIAALAVARKRAQLAGGRPSGGRAAASLGEAR